MTDVEFDRVTTGLGFFLLLGWEVAFLAIAYTIATDSHTGSSDRFFVCALFVIGAILNLWRVVFQGRILFRKGPALALNSVGVTVNCGSPPVGFIPWSAIEHFSIGLEAAQGPPGGRRNFLFVDLRTKGQYGVKGSRLVLATQQFAWDQYELVTYLNACLISSRNRK